MNGPVESSANGEIVNLPEGFERATDTDYKVGEATVELFSNYLIRKLGLTSHLYENHLPKNGLRFFFDNEQKNAPIEKMSEIGSYGLPFHPSFQIDRSTFERELRDALGGLVYSGTSDIQRNIIARLLGVGR